MKTFALCAILCCFLSCGYSGRDQSEGWGLFPTSGEPVTADGGAGMFLLYAPSKAADTGIRMTPDYYDTLDLEYQYQGDETIREMYRPVHGSITSRVWRSAADDYPFGPVNVRFRWVVDGKDQSWSDYTSLEVTDSAVQTESSVTNGYGDSVTDPVTFYFDDIYPVGQFAADGEWWVAAPDGITLTDVTPVKTGTGTSLRNGMMVDPDIRFQALDGRYATGLNFFESNNTELPVTLYPGQIVYKGVSNPELNTEKHVRAAASLTVLAERPPEGCFRPAVYGHADRIMYHTMEMDMSMLPLLDFAAWNETVRYETYEGKTYYQDVGCGLRRIGAAMGGGSVASRATYPYMHMSNYHRGTSRDLGRGMWWSINSRLPEEERMKYARAVVQRIIDFSAGNERLWIYYWEAPFIYAGSVMNVTRWRNFHSCGAAVGAPYDATNTNGAESKFVTVYQLAETAGGPDDNAGEWPAWDDLWKVWDDLRYDRIIPYSSDKPAPRIPGVYNNGDGTWTIPAYRFICGNTVHRGRVGLLNPEFTEYDASWGLPGEQYFASTVYAADGSRGWDDIANRPHKSYYYLYQHTPCVAQFSLFLRVMNFEGYNTVRNYLEWGEEYMGTPREWVAACTGSPDTNSGAAIWGVYPPQNNYVMPASDWWKLRDNLPGLRYTRSAPGPMKRTMFRIADLHSGDQVSLKITRLPDDGWCPIRDFEYSINSGGWISYGGKINKTRIFDGFSPGETVSVSVRAVNMFGPGPASLERSVTLSTPIAYVTSRKKPAPASSGESYSFILPDAEPGDVRIVLVSRSVYQSVLTPADWECVGSWTGGSPESLFIFKQTVNAGNAEGYTAVFQNDGDKFRGWAAVAVTFRCSPGVTGFTFGMPEFKGEGWGDYAELPRLSGVTEPALILHGGATRGGVWSFQEESDTELSAYRGLWSSVNSDAGPSAFIMTVPHTGSDPTPLRTVDLSTFDDSSLFSVAVYGE